MGKLAIHILNLILPGTGIFRLMLMAMLFLSGILKSIAQEGPSMLSNLNVGTFYYQEEPLRIDSNSVVVLFLVIEGDTIWPTDDFYTFDHAFLYFKPEFMDTYGDQKPFDVYFRKLPVRFDTEFRRLDSGLIQKEQALDYIGFSYQETTIRDPLVDMKGVNYSGSFSRGLSMGNRQNLVLNSSLNLQMAGTIGEDLELLAAISDNNIPIQPEGNTQQLQEFDRIFIELKRKQTSIRAGDFELTRPKGYFLNYFKRSQGLLVNHSGNLASGHRVDANASISISKGKFRRQILQPIEGNQGPYRLLGNDGESFIIVLANTEKVFLDGELLRRGLELDYVIDYNRGELIFTAKRLITKELRIIIEFEYSDQNYLRSMYTASTTYAGENWDLRFNYFSEQDNKNSPGNQFLSDEDKLLLSQVGDRLEDAFVSSVRQPGDDQLLSNPILYELIDTTVMDGRSFSGILRYSPDEAATRVSAVFSDFGEGNGNYIISNNLANGRVYEWIPPDPLSGMPRGRYEPRIRIVTPKQQRMMSLGGSYSPGNKQHLKAELALSTLDQNRYSSLDASDNQGVAVFLDYTGDFQLDSSGYWNVTPLVSYELKGVNFRPVNPYRNAEFNRDWNIDAAANQTEHVINTGFQLGYKNAGKLNYQLSSFIQGDLYRAFRHQYDLNLNLGQTKVRVFGSEMNAESAGILNRFSRPKVEVVHSTNLFDVGIYGEQENNTFFSSSTDSLSSGSFLWNIGRAFIRTKEDKRLQMQLSYTVREDKFPVGGNFRVASNASEWRLEGRFQQSKQARLSWNFTSRNLTVPDTANFNFRPQRTFLGRVNYQLNALKNTIRLNTAYELGSGQEPKLEFVYLEVRPGEGQYIWTDRNGDGVPQLDEFEIAPFVDEANYIRVATLTNEFVRTNNVLLNQQLIIDPRAIWFNQSGWKKWVSRLSLHSNLNLNRKSEAGSDPFYWNPVSTDFFSPNIVNVGVVSRQSFFFNRANPKYELQYNLINLNNRSLLTTGFESRKSEEQNINIRVNPISPVSIQTILGLLSRSNDSEAFTTRNYEIEGYEIKQEFNWQYKQGIRFSGKWRYTHQDNQLGEIGEMAKISEVGLQSVVNSSSNFVLRAEFSIAGVSFSGEQNSALEFAMLEGLKAGSNYLWNLQFEKSMINNVQFLLSYEGRKTGNANIVHVGRMQIRATF